MKLPSGITPYYADERAGIYIINADCRDVLPLLEPGSVDLVLTDPPYDIEYASNRGASWQQTTIAGDKDTALRDWLVGWAIHLDLPALVFGTWKRPRPTATRAVLIWDKGPASGMGNLSFPWKTSYEEIYVMGNGFMGRRDEGVIKGHLMVSWESHGRCHPNQKPESLIRYLMSKHAAVTVLDPFMGSGTTLVAAKQLGRKAIGIEVEPKYCEIAVQRLQQEVLPLSLTPPLPARQGKMWE